MTKININTPEENQADKLVSPIEEACRNQAGDTPEPAETNEEPDEMTKTRMEATENYDRFLRVSAEFENYKKRAAKDREEYYKYANESFIKSLLPVVDYLEMGLDAARKSANPDQNLLQGFELMASEFYKVLKNAHVEVLEPVLGCDFDPNVQECVMQQETDEYSPNKVCGLYQKGYKLHDRLLRPARVVTSKCM